MLLDSKRKHVKVRPANLRSWAMTLDELRHHPSPPPRMACSAIPALNAALPLDFIAFNEDARQVRIAGVTSASDCKSIPSITRKARPNAATTIWNGRSGASAIAALNGIRFNRPLPRHTSLAEAIGKVVSRQLQRVQTED